MDYAKIICFVIVVVLVAGLFYGIGHENGYNTGYFDGCNEVGEWDEEFDDMKQQHKENMQRVEDDIHRGCRQTSGRIFP